MFDWKYRLWLIKYISGVLLPPVALLSVFLWGLKAISDFRPLYLSELSLYLVFIPLYWDFVGRLTEWQDEINARKLGANLIPLIKGKRMDLIARYKKGITDGYPGQIVDELLDEAGVDTARLCLFGVTRVITRDHDVSKFILSTGFNNFEIGEAVVIRLESFFGKGIFVADGETAKMHRALARPYFARDRVSDYTIFHKHCDKMLDVLHKSACADKPIDMQDLFLTFTFDTSVEFLFGSEDLATFTRDLPRAKDSDAEPEPKDAAKFLHAFNQGKANSQARLGQPQVFWTAAEFFKDSQADVKKDISDYLDPLVRAAIRRKEHRAGNDENYGPERLFVDHLVKSTNDISVMKDGLMNIMQAARDTTAGLLTFACYLLATSPSAMERAREEVLARYGRTEVPTYDNLKQLKYIRAVLNETLRLFPVAPINSRQSKGQTIIPTREGPLYVPRSWQFLYSAISIQKRKDLWGDDADAFDPLRWIDGREKDMTADPFRFIPFNAGPRICLGQQFAYNEASFVLVRLLQHFDSFILMQAEAAPNGSLPPHEWKSGTGRQSIELICPVMLMTLFCKGGLWLRMRAASD
ncbi:hypothetical protein FRB95_004942 [Tulasnella sp. JGI-2019a]|nr:hypothetical protein FRB93_005912 [Tulasnella sp. JGI-2019a]KAG9029740.1 hypothetical protein FRB95_004942 [Tulasnella sp. JGI-2019a]